MFTAMLQLNTERKRGYIFGYPLLKMRRRFRSKITIRIGNSIPIEIDSDKQLRELAFYRGNCIQIVIDGADEMKAASALVDFFNHGQILEQV